MRVIFTLFRHFSPSYRILLLVLILVQNLAYGQEKNLIQVSGIVVSGDSLYGVPGAYIYSPKTGRGTTSNYLGFFSLPAITGDTLAIKAIGFKQMQYVVPSVPEKFSVVLELDADTSYLPTVEIFPWATEKEFKDAFLSLNLDNTQQNYAMQNINSRIINKMLYNMQDDGSLNHRYFINQQTASKSILPTFNFIDPFAWAKFIKSVKKGEHKQRDDK